METKTTITFSEEERMILHKARLIFCELLYTMYDDSADNLHTVADDPYTTEELGRVENLLHYLADFDNKFEVD